MRLICIKKLKLIPLFSVILLLALFLSLALNPVQAKSASYNILKKSIEQLKRQNQMLQDKLTIHTKSISSQSEILQVLQESISQSHIQAKSREASADLHITLYRTLVLFTLALLISALYLFSKKYLPFLRKHKALLKELDQRTEPHQNEIDEVKQNTLLVLKDAKAIKQKITSAATESDERISHLEQDIENIHKAELLSKNQVSSNLATLDKLLKKPLLQGLSEQDITTIQSLLEEGHLDFINSLKVKGLISEHNSNWHDAIKYWDTILLEKPKNNEALLHIGFSYFKLATMYRKKESYLNSAESSYDQIMVSSPEYFEDTYGFDDQVVDPDHINTNPDELWLHQQVDSLIIKTDELRNYHAVLNIACEYSAVGNTEYARECLEQISSIYHASNYKQLQNDKDLESVRDQDWFKRIIKEASEISLAELR